jgi:hypothetical protein
VVLSDEHMRRLDAVPSCACRRLIVPRRATADGSTTTDGRQPRSEQ